MRLATAEGVAEELGITVAKLNAAFSTVGKAQATARVDQKLKDGDITQAQATEMKERIAASTFGGFGDKGHKGRGHHGHGGGGKSFGSPRGDAPLRKARRRARLRRRSQSRSRLEHGTVEGRFGALRRFGAVALYAGATANAA